MNKHFESTAYLINDFRWRKEPQHKFEKKISYRCEIQKKCSMIIIIRDDSKEMRKIGAVSVFMI